jgi:hypothetical protein
MPVHATYVIVLNLSICISAFLGLFTRKLHAKIDNYHRRYLGELCRLVAALLKAGIKVMAITIIFGLAFATALTLLVVQVLYAMFFRVPVIAKRAAAPA